jgi:hypothetical protein
MYYERLNFRPYRLRPKRFHYNGGFAAARWLGNERVLRRSTLDPNAETTLSEALFRSHGSWLATLLTGATTEAPAPIRIAGIDPWGLDLGRGDRLRRLPFPCALTEAAAIGAYLDTLTTSMEG